jgi:hypothetical protein
MIRLSIRLMTGCWFLAIRHLKMRSFQFAAGLGLIQTEPILVMSIVRSNACISFQLGGGIPTISETDSVTAPTTVTLRGKAVKIG